MACRAMQITWLRGFGSSPDAFLSSRPHVTYRHTLYIRIMEILDAIFASSIEAHIGRVYLVHLVVNSITCLSRAYTRMRENARRSGTWVQL